MFEEMIKIKIVQLAVLEFAPLCNDQQTRLAGITQYLGGLRPSPPGIFHILMGKFSYFVIRFLNQIFWALHFLSLTFPILLSDFYLIAL